MDQENSNMPVITLQQDRFSDFVGHELTIEEIEEQIPWIGFDIEEKGEDYIKVEFNPNRVDFSSHIGVARAFQGLKGWKTGIPQYRVHKSDVMLEIDKSVQEVRPYMLGAVVREMELDNATVKELMDIQEDLHWGVGRDRKKASIGIHNLDNIKPPFKYLGANPQEARFVPLGETNEMTLQEIIEKHENGRAYKHLVDWSLKYPLLIDHRGEVLSMPPIINGELTKLDTETNTLFLDVTGPDLKAVEQCLNVLVTALADMNGRIESIQVKYPERIRYSPDLTPQKMTLKPSYANKLLGLKLSEDQIIKCLEKCRLSAKTTKGSIYVEVPAYRIDILHEVDLVEEVAIGYRYYRLKPSQPQTVTTGGYHEVTRLADTIRQIMIGLNFTEVVNFILTNENRQFTMMRRKPQETIKIANPVSSEYSIARACLIPSLMKNLVDNKHESFPQRIFEVADIIAFNPKAECRSQRKLQLAGVLSHAAASFTEIKSIVEALLANIGMKKWEMNPVSDPSFIQGRVARITLGKKDVGCLGEIHPEVLNNFELENPVCSFEMNLESLLS
jgi:phenylalanyl-tRNA synthetase beta chain